MRRVIEDWEFLAWCLGALIVFTIFPHHFERILPMSLALGVLAFALHVARLLRYPGLRESRSLATVFSQWLLTWVLLLFLPVVALISCIRFVPNTVFGRLFPVRRLLWRTGLGFAYGRGRQVRIDATSSKIEHRLAIGTVREIGVIAQRDSLGAMDDLPIGTAVYFVEVHGGTILKVEEAELDPLYEPEGPAEAKSSGAIPESNPPDRVQLRPRWRYVSLWVAMILIVSIDVGVLEGNGSWLDDHFTVVFFGEVLLFFLGFAVSQLGFVPKLQSFGETFSREEIAFWVLISFAGAAVLELIAMLLLTGGIYFIAVVVLLSVSLFATVKLVKLRNLQ